MINNIDNVVEIPTAMYQRISGYYSSKSVVDKSTVRDWLTGQSFEKQYKFGIKVIKMFKK